MAEKSDPVFENLFLKGLAEAIVRKRSALHSHAKAWTLDRGTDERHGIRFERLDLRVKPLIPNTVFQFTAWEDSKAWVDVRQHRNKAGQKFEVSLDADLWDVDLNEIVRKIEATLDLAPSSGEGSNPEKQKAIAQLWASNRPPSDEKRKKQK